MPSISSDRGTVLLDALSEDGLFDRSMLERLGHPVVVCNGPDPKTLCPLLDGSGCASFEEAHGIVFELDLDRPQHRAIVKRYQELAEPGVPIMVVIRPEHAERYADLLAGVYVVDHPPTAADLDGFAAEVEAAERSR